MGSIIRKKMSEIRSKRSRTIWARVLSQSDEEIVRAAATDLDARIFDEFQSRTTLQEG